MSALTPERRAELRKYVTPPFDIGHGCTVTGGPTSVPIQTATVISLLDEIDAQAARIAELEVTAERRGRCSKHKDEPGPSLYFDCCESERLRGLIRHRDDYIAWLERRIKACAASIETSAGVNSGPYADQVRAILEENP